MRAEDIKQAWKTNPDKVASAFGKSLRSFGYGSVTDGYIKEQVTKILAGDKPVGVIAMFIDGWLKEGINW